MRVRIEYPMGFSISVAQMDVSRAHAQPMDFNSTFVEITLCLALLFYIVMCGVGYINNPQDDGEAARNRDL